MMSNHQHNNMTKIEWIKQLDNDELYDLINENFETFPEEIKLDGPRKILNRDVAEEIADDEVSEYGFGLDKKTIVVDRTESQHTSVTYRTKIELSEIRENNDITIMSMSDEDLIQAIEQDPSDYVEDLYDGEVVYDKSKDMGSYDDVSVE
jgi:hypothetical protein